MVIVDVSATILVPDTRARGWSIAIGLAVVISVSSAGMILGFMGLTDTHPLMWLALLVVGPTLIVGVQSWRFRGLANAAKARSGPGACLFSDAALSSELSPDGALLRGEKLGPGWLVVTSVGMEIWQHPGDQRASLIIDRDSIAAIECLRLWRGILSNPMLRIRLADGQVIDTVPCVAGVAGTFGIGQSRLISVIASMEADLRGA